MPKPKQPLKKASAVEKLHPAQQYEQLLNKLKTLLRLHIQGVPLYSAEFTINTCRSLASSIPLLAAYATEDYLSDLQDERQDDSENFREISKEIAAIQTELRSIIYAMEAEGMDSSENRYHKSIRVD